MTSQTIFYPTALRERFWPAPLADEWHSIYPEIFDDRDLEQTVTQPNKHFCEWFTAVHIFHSTGRLSLIEKAEFGQSHPRKRAVVDRFLSAQRQERLRKICSANGVQWPDLFVYDDGGAELSFAEAKGPGDSLSPAQLASHAAIERDLGIKVIIFHLKESRAGV